MSLIDSHTRSNNLKDTVNTAQYAILPRQLPVKKLGLQYGKIIGYVNTESFSRLNDIIISSSNCDNKKIYIELDFSQDINQINKYILINGKINHSVNVICQRCLKLMDYNIKSTIAVALVEKLKNINSFINIDEKLGNYEPVELVEFDNNYMVDLYQIIEDEILLSLPSAIKHNSCESLDNS